MPKKITNTNKCSLLLANSKDDNLPALRKEYTIIPLNGLRRLTRPSPPLQGQIWSLAMQKLCITCKQQRESGTCSSHSAPQHRLLFTFLFFEALSTPQLCNKLQLVITALVFWGLLLEALIFNVCYSQLCVEAWDVFNNDNSHLSAWVMGWWDITTLSNTGRSEQKRQTESGGRQGRALS